MVSTHSRPKAAGCCCYFCRSISVCFNTQPPEGGWSQMHNLLSQYFRFQHTAARRRLGSRTFWLVTNCLFQHTAARRRLVSGIFEPLERVGFNTQPPEGGWRLIVADDKRYELFQHTAARRRLAAARAGCSGRQWFQHTAARRRLDNFHIAPS